MSSTTEWRKLSRNSSCTPANYDFIRDALSAACTRLDEQANLLGIANEQWGKTIARAEAAEALLKVAVEAITRFFAAEAVMQDFQERGQDDSGKRTTPSYREWVAKDCEYTEAREALAKLKGGAVSNDQLSDQKSDVLSPAQVEDLKQAWMKGKGLSTLPPVGNLIMRLIATVEQARRAFDVANRKWDEQQARADKAEAELARVTAEAAHLREALQDIEKHGMGVDPLVARDALSSTSAGAGLLKRLEASEAAIEQLSLNAARTGERADLSRDDRKALEAWKRARGEP